MWVKALSLLAMVVRLGCQFWNTQTQDSRPLPPPEEDPVVLPLELDELVPEVLEVVCPDDPPEVVALLDEVE